jgi:hypothetical protein
MAAAAAFISNPMKLAGFALNPAAAKELKAPCAEGLVAPPPDPY